MSDPNKQLCALNHLPPDLVEAILPFLPVKSLGRFKSVSKRWYSLISSPNFIKNHILNYSKNNYNPNPTHLILLPVYAEISLFSLDVKQINNQTTTATVTATATAKSLNFQEQWLKIQGSCNGLVLANDTDYNLYILNPTTQKTLKLPDGKGFGVTYGFGYDSSKDDYKVIHITYNVTGTLVHMYSLRNSSWKMVPNPPYYLNDLCTTFPGVLINNNLHWVVTGKRRTLIIVAFNIVDEEFDEIEFSDDSVSWDRGMCWRLDTFDGKLSALLYLKFVSVIELWVMEEYGVPKSWTKLCVFEKIPDLHFRLCTQVSHRDILLGNNNANEMFIYNLDEKRCTSVTIEGCQEKISVYGAYVESLESPERFR